MIILPPVLKANQTQQQPDLLAQLQRIREHEFTRLMKIANFQLLLTLLAVLIAILVGLAESREVLEKRESRDVRGRLQRHPTVGLKKTTDKTTSCLQM